MFNSYTMHCEGRLKFRSNNPSYYNRDGPWSRFDCRWYILIRECI